MKLELGDRAYVRKLADVGHPMFASDDGKGVLARLLIEEGNFASAEQVVLELILRGKTPDALRLLRRLPPDGALLDRACAAFQRSVRSPYRKAVQAAHLMEFASLAGDLDKGFDLSDQAMQWLDGATPEPAVGEDREKDRSAELDRALADFHELMKEAGEFFLISGTLLGVMRDGQLMGYDKDVDVGVFDDAVISRAEALAEASFVFSRDISQNISGVKLKHRNGVVIDVFLQHVEGGTVWHGGPAHVWDNSRWWSDDADRLATTTYKGREYRIPKAWETYLGENYGDWRTPVQGFTASIDAPNRRLADRPLAKLHRRSDLIKYYHRGDFERLVATMAIYERDFGTDSFLAEARRVMFADAPAEAHPLVAARLAEPA